MFVSTLAALALFAAPDAAQSGDAAPEAKPAAEAKPATRKVCSKIEVAGSSVPKKKCKTVPVNAEPAKVAEESTVKETTSE